MVGRVLRAEGEAVAGAAAAGDATLGGPWWVLAALFLTPDLSALGYVAGPKVGSVTYDAAHTYALPAPPLAVGLVSDNVPLAQLAPVWLARIGVDRLPGYGPKDATGFKERRLQRA